MGLSSCALQEDKDEIINGMRSETKSLGLLDTAENCWATFINKVKQNLHMIFTASPVGDNFRIRSQRFLATVNSTVIDWFQAWPEASLLSVANKFLADVQLGEDAVGRIPVLLSSIVCLGMIIPFGNVLHWITGSVQKSTNFPIVRGS